MSNWNSELGADADFLMLPRNFITEDEYWEALCLQAENFRDRAAKSVAYWLCLVGEAAKGEFLNKYAIEIVRNGEKEGEKDSNKLRRIFLERLRQDLNTLISDEKLQLKVDSLISDKIEVDFLKEDLYNFEPKRLPSLWPDYRLKSNILAAFFRPIYSKLLEARDGESNLKTNPADNEVLTSFIASGVKELINKNAEDVYDRAVKSVNELGNILERLGTSKDDFIRDIAKKSLIKAGLL